MNASLRLPIAALVIVTFSIACLVLRAADRESPATEVPFLEVGKDYVILFPEDRNVFKKTTGGMTTATYKTEDGEEAESRPATWSMTFELESFKVAQLSTGPWVLLEHPKNLDDIQAWNEQRRAMAILNGPDTAVLRANDEGKRKFDELQKAADAKIATTKTWINLNQAIAIGPLSAEEANGKLVIKSISVSPK